MVQITHIFHPYDCSSPDLLSRFPLFPSAPLHPSVYSSQQSPNVSWGLPLPPLPYSDLSLHSLCVCTHSLMHWDSATLASCSCCWRMAGLPLPLSFCHHPPLCIEHPPDVLITHFLQVCPKSPPGQYFSCLTFFNLQ